MLDYVADLVNTKNTVMRSRYFLLFFFFSIYHFAIIPTDQIFGILGSLINSTLRYSSHVHGNCSLNSSSFTSLCVCVPLPLLSLYLSLQSEIRKKHNITVVNDLEIYRLQWMHFNRKISTNIQHYTNTYIHRNISMFYYPFRRFCMVINFNLIHLLCCTHLTHSHIHKYPYIIFT